MPETVQTANTVEFNSDRQKVPPHSIQAEQSLLGGLLLDNRAWDQIADLVTEADFYRRDHRMIFTASGKLIESGDPCDVLTLSNWFDAQGQLNDVGGLAYLGTLAKDTPSAANICAYAKIVRGRGHSAGAVDATVACLRGGAKRARRAIAVLVVSLLGMLTVLPVYILLSTTREGY